MTKRMRLMKKRKMMSWQSAKIKKRKKENSKRVRMKMREKK